MPIRDSGLCIRVSCGSDRGGSDRGGSYRGGSGRLGSGEAIFGGLSYNIEPLLL